VFYSAASPREAARAHATRGRLTPDALTRLGVPAEASAYFCGPASFMTGLRDALAAIGLPAGQIRIELFGALDAINPGLSGQVRRPPHAPDGPPGSGPVVTFARSGLSVPYEAARGSVLDLADACDVPTRWSCRSGVCHTCVTPLLSGAIGYTPDPLEPPAGGEVLICCARPRTDVVLDM
jgi:ferredoxin